MKKTLVIGASPSPSRYSYLATQMLLEYGHEVDLFGKQSGEISGLTIRNQFPESGSYDTVTMYVNPDNQKSLEDKILALKPKRVIFNPGTENDEFEEQLERNGIQALEACTLVLLRTKQF